MEQGPADQFLQTKKVDVGLGGKLKGLVKKGFHKLKEPPTPKGYREEQERIKKLKAVEEFQA